MPSSGSTWTPAFRRGDEQGFEKAEFIFVRARYLRQLAAQLTATDDQVIEAASKSKKVRSTVGRLGNEYRFTLPNDVEPSAPSVLGASAT
jgi:hypothetical protein